MDEFLFYKKISKVQRRNASENAPEWSEKKNKMDVVWFEQAQNSMRKAGKDFLAPSCMEGPCSLTYNVDLHLLSDERSKLATEALID